MKGLLKSELKKIACRKIFWVGLLLLLLYAVYQFVPFLIAKGYYITTAQTEEGVTLYGREAVKYNQARAQEYQGILTDETVQSMLENYTVSTEQGWNSLYPLDCVSQFIQMHFLINESEVKTVSAVYPQMEEPLYYGYSDSWEDFLHTINTQMKIVLCLVIIVLAPIFANEYQSSMASIIFTSPKGRREDVRAKIAAALILTNLCAVLFIVVESVMHLAFFGVEGWNTSIQIGWPGFFRSSPVAMNFLEAVIQGIILTILVYNCMAMLTLLISYFSKNTVTAMILSIVIFLLPSLPFFTAAEPDSMFGRILVLLPFHALNMQFVTYYRPITLFGAKIPMFYMLLFYYPVVTGIMGVFLCKVCQRDNKRVLAGN